MLIRSVISTLIALSIATASYAINVNLYQVEMAVPSQTADARTEAARVAFQQVIMRLSGDPSVFSNPVIKENLSKAGYFVQEYRYSLPTENSSEYQIRFRFDGKDINRLLQRAGISYWGSKRPLILIFLTYKNARGQIEVIGDDLSYNNLTREIKHYSEQYGLPLIMPAMDMEDLNNFTVDDITTMHLPILKAAGKRYAPEAYLIGNIERKYKSFESTWELSTNASKQTWNWTFQEQTTDKMLAKVFDQVTQKLSNRTFTKTVAAQDIWVKLEVTNIVERDELTQLIQYLKQLNIVRDIQLSQISSDSVKIAVLVEGTFANFREKATVGQRLILKGEFADANILMYEWVRNPPPPPDNNPGVANLGA